jgi:hypothetical protein
MRQGNVKPHLVGEKINLRTATLQDKEKIFKWLTASNLTKEMMGLPNFPVPRISVPPNF